MKKITLFTLSILLFLSCTKKENILKGSGNLTSNTKKVSTFSRLEVDGPIDVFIHQNNENELTIETDDNLVQLIDVEIEGNLLRISYKKPSGYSSVQSTKGLNVYVNSDQLIELKNYGSGNILSSDVWEVDDMEIENSSSGNIKFELNAHVLNVENKGSGQIITSGKTNHQNVSIHGSGEYKASSLTSNSASVVIMGSGNATINVEKELNAHIMGSGNLRYQGDPKITSQIIGSGVIEKL